MALKSLEPSRKWAWKVPSTSNLTTNKDTNFFAVIRQTGSHKIIPLDKVKNEKRFINAKINLQTYQLVGRGRACWKTADKQSGGATATRRWWQKIWAHHWLSRRPGDKGYCKVQISHSFSMSFYVFLIAFYLTAKICLGDSCKPETQTWQSLEQG